MAMDKSGTLVARLDSARIDYEHSYRCWCSSIGKQAGELVNGIGIEL